MEEEVGIRSPAPLMYGSQAKSCIRLLQQKKVDEERKRELNSRMSAKRRGGGLLDMHYVEREE